MKEAFLWFAISAFLIGLAWACGDDPEKTRVWIGDCEFIRIEEGVGHGHTVNYVPTNNCKQKAK